MRAFHYQHRHSVALSRTTRHGVSRGVDEPLVVQMEDAAAKWDAMAKSFDGARVYLGEPAAAQPEEVFANFEKLLAIVNQEMTLVRDCVTVCARAVMNDCWQRCHSVSFSPPMSRSWWAAADEGDDEWPFASLLQFLTDKERAEKKARLDAAKAAKEAAAKQRTAGAR